MVLSSAYPRGSSYINYQSNQASRYPGLLVESKILEIYEGNVEKKEENEEKEGKWNRDDHEEKARKLKIIEGF